MKVVLVGASFAARTHQRRNGAPVYSSTFSSTEKRGEKIRQKLGRDNKKGEKNRLPTYFAKGTVPSQMRRLST
jgi:hypothetical protein